MTTARNPELTLQALRQHYNQQYEHNEQWLKAKKRAIDLDIQNYAAFVESIYTLYETNRTDPEIFNEYNDKIITRLGSPASFQRFKSPVFRNEYQALLQTLTLLCDVTARETTLDLRPQLSKACIDALWLADCLIKKSNVPLSHRFKIIKLTKNIEAAANYAKDPIDPNNIQQLADTTDIMIRGFNTNDFLVYPEERYFKRYASGIALILLTAAAVTVGVTSPILLPFAITLLIVLSLVPPLLSLHLCTGSYAP